MNVDLALYREWVTLSRSPLLRLSVIDIQPEQPRATIVLLHGFGGWATQWKYQLRALSDDNRVIAPDLRGHGHSDKPHSTYKVDEFLSDLEILLEQLEVREPFFLVGHSFGGAIAAEYAAAHPERLRGLVLISTGGEFRLHPAARFVFHLPVAVLRLIKPFSGRAFAAPPHVLRPFFHNALNAWNGWSTFRNITVPTQVIIGHRDRLLPGTLFSEVARCIPNAEEVRIPVSAHLVHMERPDAVYRAIRRFIGQERGSWRGDSGRPQLVRERPWLPRYDDKVPYTVAIPKRPLHRFLESAARRFPRRPAVRFFGRRLSYAALNQHANRFANALIALGVTPGSRVLLLMPNCPQFIIAYYGALKAGATVVLTSPVAETDEVVRQVNDSGSRVLVTLSLFENMARRISQTTALDTVILTSIKEYMGLPARLWFALTKERHEGHRFPGELKAGFYRWDELEPGFYRWDKLLRRRPATAPEVDVGCNDLALIQYTGGTTARPKGVMLSHYNLVANTLQVRHWIPDLREGDEGFLSVLPLSHVYGMTTAMNVPISLAASMVVLPTFVTQEVLRAIRRYRPTIFPGVPPMYVAINNFPHVRRYGIHSIRACISGAAPLPVEVQEAFEKLTRGRLVEGYGLTEASPVTHANPLNGLRKVGSIGIPLPNTDARVVDLATGQDLPPGQIGELVVRGPQVMQGYWGDSGETDRALKDGWLYTGDIARMDEDGYFQLISRKKDMILAGPYQVYPRDVEEVLYEHPRVKEVAVVGVQAPRWPSKQIKAYVVLRDGENLTEEELIAFCKQRLEEWQVPWQIEFRRELPKSFVGKVLRRLLVEEERE
jgi:long-chain acyl-CoA synthetase